MTNSHEVPPCEIGERIECGNSFGTVRFIGPLEGRPSIWLGVDWDDPQRGKHDGSVNGVRYFTTRHPTSGSFVRPAKVAFGRSALASIESRYGQGEDEFTSKINQQKHLLFQQTMNAPFLEMVGFDKVFHRQSDFNALRIVSLRGQNVSTPGLKLGEMCPNVEELDVSRNLFVSWNDVLLICEQLGQLNWLNVSENLLEMPESLGDVRYPKLKTLICGDMELTWHDVCKVVAVFPNVEELRAPHNKIEDLNLNEGVFAKLKLLDIEGNTIGRWSEICKLGVTPVEQLNLENCSLLSIEFEGSTSPVPLFKMLKKLSIVNNLIKEWRSVDQLNRLESLEHLKISKNPVTESEMQDTVHQILIARISNLKILNGVEIEPAERRGAEYDYIKKFGLEWLKVKDTEQRDAFLKDHSRYLELVEKYGEPEESELRIKSQMIKSSLIQLNLIHEDVSVEKRLPPTMTVQKLTVLAQKIFRLGERPRLTYVSSSDSHIEVGLDDEMKEIALYSMQDGDRIVVGP